MVTKCEVCTLLEKKYKCPTCNILYCSVACFKTHIDNCIPSVKSTEDPHVESSSTSGVHKFQTAETVPVDQLQLLRKSEALKELLRNPHLQEFLKTIDSSENPPRLMRKAMQEPLFIEFVDECLKVIEPTGIQLTDEQVLAAIQEDIENQE
ncbi:zinc finger HIT domain-containing protein 3 [Eurytemora carolleeae]|uniref:zinc finger HIT domain-containing protein 3 n=1 Tax=Eurytemora carolleeae TaxID=1294199 RepID=UPI000C76CC01|nr:zinc finger HIT domain-containing protein 3 [Eurytemora carolleeae]|eukprot:XP_023344810.1 zinc finger HIT domain-containing protein 3-like [Eurytemora affinis]